MSQPFMALGSYTITHDGRCWHLTQTKETSHHRAKGDTAETTTYHGNIMGVFRHIAEDEMSQVKAVGLHNIAKAIAERLTRLEEAAKWFAAEHGYDHVGKALETGEFVKRTRNRETKERERVVKKVKK